jgi:cytoskeleton protein RodZ
MSALPKQETESVLAELPQPKGPGARLKAARQAKNIELETAAAQLHLRRDMLIALEEDDYDQLPARVFVFGYMKNYARYVGIPAEAIIQSLENFLPVDDKIKGELPKIGNQASEVFKPSSKARKSPFSFFSIVFLGVVIVAFFAWQEGYFDSKTGEISSSLAIGESMSGQMIEEQISIETPDPVVSVQQRESVSEKPAPMFADLPESKIESSPNVEPIAMTVPLEISVSQAPVVKEIEKTEIAQTAGKETVSTATSQEKITETPAVPVTSNGIVLKLSGKSWIEVRDSSGAFKLNNLYNAGTEKTFAGKPPYKVLIGNAAEASMMVNGKNFDLKNHTSGNIARFTLDPATL